MAGSNTNPAAFDAFAADYDNTFTNSTLGQLLRARVWAKLADYFSPGQHVLELACGTGEDAVWLAHRGLRVTATDASAGMVRQTKAKAEARENIDVIQLSLQQITNYQLPFTNKFDGVISNFGGLNTINTWPQLAGSLSKIVKPGGVVLLVPMGPLCPWEMGWYLGHLRPKTAFRRFGEASANIGGTEIPVWYPSVRELRGAFAPWFAHVETSSLGLWLPPSYLGHFVDRFPRLFTQLNAFENATARLTGGWGDHYICVFKRISPQINTDKHR